MPTPRLPVFPAPRPHVLMMSPCTGVPSPHVCLSQIALCDAGVPARCHGSPAVTVTQTSLTASPHRDTTLPHPQLPVAPLPAFPTAEDRDDDTAEDTQAMVRAQNKKKKSGGFQSMGMCRVGVTPPAEPLTVHMSPHCFHVPAGLSYPVFKGVMKKGYKVPTPIQRKVRPWGAGAVLCPPMGH